MNYALNLTSDTFNQFKHDFDSIIQGTIQTMEQKGSLDATIAVTFNISFSEDSAPDPKISAYAARRDIIIPKISHKIKSVIKVEDSRSGYVGGAKFELIWDKAEQCYFIRRISDCEPNLFNYQNAAADAEGDVYDPDEIEVTNTIEIDDEEGE